MLALGELPARAAGGGNSGMVSRDSAKQPHGHSSLQVIPKCCWRRPCWSSGNFLKGVLPCRIQTIWHNGLFSGGLWCDVHIHGILCISEGYSWNKHIVYSQKWVFNTLSVFNFFSSLSLKQQLRPYLFIAPIILVSGIDPPGLLLMHLPILSVSSRRLLVFLNLLLDILIAGARGKCNIAILPHRGGFGGEDRFLGGPSPRLLQIPTSPLSSINCVSFVDNTFFLKVLWVAVLPFTFTELILVY